MRPHNGHLMPLPVALYRLQFDVVGFAPPGRFASSRSPLTSRGRRAVPTGAAAGRSPVRGGRPRLPQPRARLGRRCSGASSSSVTLAVLGGLVAWLALDRNTPTADVVACVALVVGTCQLLRRSALRRRVAVELAPSRRLPHQLVGSGRAPRPVRDRLPDVRRQQTHARASVARPAGRSTRRRPRPAASPCSARTGGGRYWRSWAPPSRSPPLRRRITPRLAGLLVAGVLFWLLTGASRSSGLHADSPHASRYVEIGAPIVLLVTVELCRGRPLTDGGGSRSPAPRDLRSARRERARRAGRLVAPQLRRRPRRPWRRSSSPGRTSIPT